MDVAIRQLKPNDLETLRELNRQLFASDDRNIDDLNLNWPDTEVGLNYYKKVVNSEDNTIGFLAELDGQPVGYVALAKKNLTYRHKKYVEIENIYVSENFRSHGIGKKLVAEASQWAKAEGCDRLLVQAFAKNNRALEFYENYGFTKSAITLEVDID